MPGLSPSSNIRTPPEWFSGPAIQLEDVTVLTGEVTFPVPTAVAAVATSATVRLNTRKEFLVSLGAVNDRLQMAGLGSLTIIPTGAFSATLGRSYDGLADVELNVINPAPIPRLLSDKASSSGRSMTATCQSRPGSHSIRCEGYPASRNHVEEAAAIGPCWGKIYYEVQCIRLLLMSADTDELRQLYLDVAGEETVTETQEEDPSRDPIEEAESELEAEVQSFTTEHGLEDALDGIETEA